MVQVKYDVRPPSDPPPPVTKRVLGITHERQSKLVMNRIYQGLRPKFLSHGRQNFILGGDEFTKHLLTESLEENADDTFWLDGGFHEQLADVRLSAGVVLAAVGHRAAAAYGYITDKQVKALLKAGDAHKGRDFVEFWHTAQLSERAMSYLRGFGKQRHLHNDCEDAVATLMRIRGDSLTAVVTAVPDVLQSKLRQLAAARQAAGQHQRSPSNAASAAKRRRVEPVCVTGNSALATAINSALSELDGEALPGTEELKCLQTLASCPHGCCSADSASAHARNSPDQTANNLARLFDDCVSVTCAEQFAIRFRSPILHMVARKQLLHMRAARGHKQYDQAGVSCIASRLALHPAALALVQELESFSFSGHDGQNEAFDAHGEESIKEFKHQPRRSDRDEHVEASVRLLAHNVDLRAALNKWLALTPRARRPRTQEPVGETLASMRAVISEAKLFEDCGRKAWTNADGKPLATEATRIFEMGQQRIDQFIQERYIDKSVDLHAPRHAADTTRLPISRAEAGEADPEPPTDHKGQGAHVMDTSAYGKESKGHAKSKATGSSDSKRGKASKANGKDEKESRSGKPKRKRARRKSTSRQQSDETGEDLYNPSDDSGTEKAAAPSSSRGKRKAAVLSRDRTAAMSVTEEDEDEDADEEYEREEEDEESEDEEAMDVD